MYVYNIYIYIYIMFLSRLVIMSLTQVYTDIIYVVF